MPLVTLTIRKTKSNEFTDNQQPRPAPPRRGRRDPLHTKNHPKTVGKPH